VVQIHTHPPIKEIVMSTEGFIKIMEYLDIIESELDKLAKIVGHCSYAEFISRGCPTSSGEFTGP
jgi:hypothetical protein